LAPVESVLQPQLPVWATAITRDQLSHGEGPWRERALKKEYDPQRNRQGRYFPVNMKIR